MERWILVSSNLLWFCVATGLAIRLYLLQKQMKSLKDQLLFIQKEDTNQILTTQIHLKELEELVLLVNGVLKKHRNLEIALLKMNKSFKETITSISHDIRTPLTSAVGYIQMLGNEKISIEKKKEYIVVIKKRIEEVKIMLNQLFEYARIESGEFILESESVNINNILRDTISIFYDDYVKKGQIPQIDMCEEICSVQGDKNAMKRIFENIIQNSLIHGIGDYKILLEKKGHQIYICFSNCTNSIQTQDLEQIFERFYTSDHSRTRKTTGLGLSIARSLITYMNGTIEAQLAGDIFMIIVELPEREMLPCSIKK